MRINRNGTFMFRVSPDERRLIAALAEKLQRTQSDAVRFVVINASRQLSSNPTVQNKINLPQEDIVKSLPTEA